MFRRIFGFDTLLLFPSIFETVKHSCELYSKKKTHEFKEPEEGKECLENVVYKTDAQNHAVGCS